MRQYAVTFRAPHNPLLEGAVVVVSAKNKSEARKRAVASELMPRGWEIVSVDPRRAVAR